MFSKKLKKGVNINKGGFTLIEMIVVLGIFGVLTSIVVFNYNKFTSDTVLTNMAYEMALSVREVQVFGTAVVGLKGGIAFNTPLGLNIDITNGPTAAYLSFVDTNKDGKYLVGDNVMNNFTLLRGTKITSLKVKDGASCSEQSKLVVIFERPNPEPVINTKRLQTAQIEMMSQQGSKAYIVINGVGEVKVVSKPEICL